MMLRMISFLAVVLVASMAMGGEPFVLVQYAGDQPGVISVNWSTLLQDPLIMAAIVIGGLLIVSKFFKVDVTPFLYPVLNTLLKPPPSTPSPNPSPPPAPVPAPSTDLLQLLLKLLTDAKAKGDTAGEAAIFEVLKRVR